MYGLPLVQKSQDKSTLERIISFFDYNNPSSLPKKIEFVANTGSTEVLKLEADGLWEVHPFDENSPLNNSIIFSFFSKVTNINTQDPISLTPGASCTSRSGVVGKDSFSIICIKGKPLFDGYNITYMVFLRNLTSPSGEVYSIQLTTSTNTLMRSTGKTIRITRESIDKTSSFIVTKIKIEIS